MERCPICGSEISEPRLWAQNWPFEGQALCSRACNEARYEMRERARDETWSLLVSAIVEKLGVAEIVAAWTINGVSGKIPVPTDIEAGIRAYHTAFGTRPPQPIDPFKVPLFREMVGNLLTIRPED